MNNAAKKIPEGEDGSVPPRVLAGIVNDGSFCDDEVAVEYLRRIAACHGTTVEPPWPRW